jgi:hypothetical protein
MPTFRPDVTDKQQDVLENAAFEGGVPVHVDDEIRVVAKGNQTGTQRTAHAVTGSGVDIKKNAGVMMPWDDKPGKFEEVIQGKA